MSRIPAAARRDPIGGLADGLRRMARGSASGRFPGAQPVSQPVLGTVLADSGDSTALILTDSSGVRWQVTVDTTGHLTTTAL